MPIESIDDLDRLERAVREHLANPQDTTHRIPAGMDVYVAKGEFIVHGVTADFVLPLAYHRLKYDLFFVDFQIQAAPTDPKRSFRVRGDLGYKNRALKFQTAISATIQTTKGFEDIGYIVVGTGNPKYPFLICEAHLIQPVVGFNA